MLIVEKANRKMFVSDTYAALFIVLTIFAIIEVSKVLWKYRKKNSKPNALHLRGGEFDHRYALDKLVLEDDNYLIKDRQILERLQFLLNCRKKKSIIVISAGLLAVVSASLNRHELSTKFLGFTITSTNPYKLLIKTITIGGPVIVAQLLSWTITKSVLGGSILLALLILRPVDEEMVKKLPLYLHNNQYVSIVDVDGQNKKQPKLIMQTDNAPVLYVSEQNQVIKTEIINKLKSKGELASQKQIKTPLSNNKLDLKNPSSGKLVLQEKTIKSYVPLHKRTKTLHDLNQETITKKDYDQGEEWEGRISERIKRSQNNKLLLPIKEKE